MERFQEQMEERWREFEREASALREGGNMVAVLAKGWYRTLEPTERRLADAVLIDWVLQDTPRRGALLALIWECRIRSTEPALRPLAADLGQTPGPAAKYQRETVLRLVDSLNGREQGSE